MKLFRRIHLLYPCLLFLFVNLLAGCSKESADTEKEADIVSGNEAETPELHPSVSGNYLYHHPENMRMVSDGTDIFVCADRGIYTVNENGWNLIYQSANIRGMDLYKDYIYFLQIDSQNTMSLNRMGRDGSGTETLCADNSMSYEVHIYNNVLYYYSDDMLIRGISFDENGNLLEASDITSDDYPFKNWNAVTEGQTQESGEALNPGYSMQYYNGRFEYKTKDELYRQLYFTSNKESQLLVPELSETAFIAGSKIYYCVAGKGDNGIYSYDMDSQNTSFFGTDSEVPVDFLNYDERYVYYTDNYLNTGAPESPVYQLDTEQGTVRELPVVIGANNSSDCFDVCGQWILYRDNMTGGLTLLNADQLDNPVPEP